MWRSIYGWIKKRFVKEQPIVVLADGLIAVPLSFSPQQDRDDYHRMRMYNYYNPTYIGYPALLDYNGKIIIREDKPATKKIKRNLPEWW